MACCDVEGGAKKKTPTETAALKASIPVRHDNNTNQQHDRVAPLRRDVIEQGTHCGRSGHNRDGCFKRIGYPDWWPGNGKRDEGKPKAAHVGSDTSPVPGLTKEQYQLLLKQFGESDAKDDIVPMASTTGKRGWDDEWVVDSGATEHITHDEAILINKIFCPNEEPVIIPDGSAIPVKGRGECYLEGGTKLKGVLYIPKFNCNLLCVSRLAKDLQCCVSFFPDFCVMRKLHTRSLIGGG